MNVNEVTYRIRGLPNDLAPGTYEVRGEIKVDAAKGVTVTVFASPLTLTEWTDEEKVP